MGKKKKTAKTLNREIKITSENIILIVLVLVLLFGFAGYILYFL